MAYSLIKSFKFRFFNFIDKGLVSFRKLKIELNPSILLSNSVYLSDSSQIDNRFGGKIKIGKGTKIYDGVLIFTYGGNINIGEYCNINPYTIIYGHSNTTIGNNVLIAGHCMIIPNNHNYIERDKNIADQGSSSKGIIIEDDVWIGHGCSILDGVIIGKGSIIAAGSVVNKSVAPFSIVGGVPARKLKDR